jgi:pimeloyl-ACP methyl ester carboxylesterase
MKPLFILFFSMAFSMKAESQTFFIKTGIGKIAVRKNCCESDKTPLILLHGVYFDHHLWDDQVGSITDRTVITIDMPLHGDSREIAKPDWTLDDCADMLGEILDSLKIPQVIAVGHSWGSMTILRAAARYPLRFESIGLCNMPFRAASRKQKLIFGLQHSMLRFRKFYSKQAAKSLFGKKSLEDNPALSDQLVLSMNILTDGEIRQIDKKVIFDAEDTTPLMQSLKVRARALKGREDYVPGPPFIETIVIEGGHVSPVEEPRMVLEFIKTLLN